jgi:hypothetical protein
VSRTWAGFLRDWARSLRSGNYPETTRYNYLFAGAQLARFLGECSPDPDADDAADDPGQVSRAHVEAFQAWMIATRSASTALNKDKCLQQFLRWQRDDEQAISRSPMDRVRPPKTPTKLERRNSEPPRQGHTELETRQRLLVHMGQTDPFDRVGRPGLPVRERQGRCAAGGSRPRGPGPDR